MDKILLIGGSPTAGKSYAARKIAEKLNLPWISTDTIREQMRELLKKEEYPALFEHHNATPEMAEEFLKQTPKEIVDFVNRENTDVWKGVKAIIDTDYTWGSFIMEGVAILPNLVSKLDDKRVKVIFILDEDEKRIREKIFKRGLWNYADTYPDHLKEKEVEWVKEYNNYLRSEAKRYGFKTIQWKENEAHISEIITLWNGQ